MLRPVLVTLLQLLLLAPGLAQEAALGFVEALQRAPQLSAEVIAARAEVVTAEQGLTRSEADPLALRLERVQAQQRLESAASALKAAQLAAQGAVADGYFAALEAAEALALARASLEIATITLEANQIRFEAGAATRLDVERAQNALFAARRAAGDAEQSRRLAHGNLASLLGAETLKLSRELEVSGRVPELETVLAGLEAVPQVLAAQQEVTLAEVTLAATDNPYSARADINAARAALENARLRLQELRRSSQLSVQRGYNAVLAAEGNKDSAQAALATAAEDLAAQTVRLEAGSISPLAFEESKLQHATAVSEAERAQHDFLRALLALEQEVNADLAVLVEEREEAPEEGEGQEAP